MEEVTDIEAIFLPPHTTSIIQPFDQTRDAFLAFDDGPPVSGLLSNADILQRVLLQTTEEVSDKDDVFAAASSEPMLSDSELRQMFHALHQGLIARESDQAIVEHVEKAMLFSRQAAVMKGQAKKSD